MPWIDFIVVDNPHLYATFIFFLYLFFLNSPVLAAAPDKNITFSRRPILPLFSMGFYITPNLTASYNLPRSLKNCIPHIVNPIERFLIYPYHQYRRLHYSLYIYNHGNSVLYLLVCVSKPYLLLLVVIFLFLFFLHFSCPRCSSRHFLYVSLQISVYNITYI